VIDFGNQDGRADTTRNRTSLALGTNGAEPRASSGGDCHPTPQSRGDYRLVGHNPTIPPNLEKARRPEIKKALPAPGILIR
jgi:hypothetical protein